VSLSTLKTLVLPAVAICCLFIVIVGLDGYLERVRPDLPPGHEDADPTFDPAKMRGFMFGFEGLVADWYWMRSLQYIGDKVASSRTPINIDDLSDLNPRLLFPYLNTATELDPHFLAAYSYGAVVLPAIDPEKAIAIAKKGILNNPDEWQLYQHLGYIYWKLGRYSEAAESYDRGSEIAGAAHFMKMMAAAMKKEGGSRETARAIYRQMLLDSVDEQAIRSAELHLQELDSLDDRDAIDQVLAEFRARNGRCANSFAEIIPLLLKVRLPENRDFSLNPAGQLVDPTGAPYLLNTETCRANLDLTTSGIPPQ
jgi:tetratricopeptide (TPR) repeat protein